MADPVLKWAGGKRQLLPELYARFPETYDRYHEPMVGGGAVLFDLEPADATVNDANPRLVNFYRQVRDRPADLLELLATYDDPDSDPDPDREHADARSYYYQQRALFNRRPRGEPVDELEEAALLLYLNRTGFNGLYRENADGEFNVPVGRYADPDWVQRDRVRAASRVLEAVEIRRDDFEYVLETADAGELVYFDPPYEPAGPTADFTEYSAGGFDAGDQRRLLDAVTALDDRGVHVLVSNSGAAARTYEDAGLFVDRVGATRAINSDADERGAVEEIIATTVPPEDRRGGGQRTITEF